MPGVAVEIRPWSEATEAEDIRRMDVGIMPIPDEPFERGKCGYKLVQYMAAELPVVASPVGVNSQIIEDGITGYVAGTNSEWVRALDRLRQDEGARTSMGKAARLKVKRAYSLQSQAPRVLAILENARLASQPKSS
jgi:glycosyltransferase involved in cell wall biosynthesis